MQMSSKVHPPYYAAYLPNATNFVKDEQMIMSCLDCYKCKSGKRCYGKAAANLNLHVKMSIWCALVLTIALTIAALVQLVWTFYHPPNRASIEPVHGDLLRKNIKV